MKLLVVIPLGQLVLHKVWISWKTSLMAAAAAKSLQSCLTLCHPMDGSPPGSPVPGILQARTRVGCHFLLQCMKVKSGSEVAQSCPTLSNAMDCGLPGFSVHGILQARMLEWGAIAFSHFNGSGGRNKVILDIWYCVTYCMVLSNNVGSLSWWLSLGIFEEFCAFPYINYGLHNYVALMVKNPPAKADMQETWVWSLGWEDVLEEEMATHSSVLCMGNPMERGIWWATVHGFTKSWTRLTTLLTLPYILIMQRKVPCIF